MLDENAIKVAVVEEQIRGLREQHKHQADATNKRLDSIDESVRAIMATLNKNKGAYAVLVVMSGAMSALILQAISFLSNSIHLTPKL